MADHEFTMTNLENAINAVTKASKEERSKNYSEALRLYEEGVELFLIAIKSDHLNDSSVGKLRELCCNYVDRIIRVRKLLVSNEKRSYGDSNEEPGHVIKRQRLSDGSEIQRLQDNLYGCILLEKPSVNWEDVAGLEGAKEALREAAILPIKFPYLFHGKRQPSKAILLYGPPGTGKSHLAKAVATEANNSTFISVLSSDLISKWQGESEKLVHALFDLARMHKPCIIFLDEVDSLFSSRADNESDSARRIKTEFLIQMQGITSDNDGILILAATNIPWILDSAFLRRFDKRIFISLPDRDARAKILKTHIGLNTPQKLSEDDYQELAHEAEGYSGSDLSIVARDTLMQPLRRIQNSTHFKMVQGESPVIKGMMVHDLLTPCCPSDSCAIKMRWMDIPPNKLLEPSIEMADMKRSLRRCKPTVNAEDLKKLKSFTEHFGEESSGQEDPLL